MKYSKKELVHHLHSGPATVTFTKKDGEKRVMHCTLEPSVVPVVESTGTRKVNDEVLAVWDTDKAAWRSFRIDSIENVEYA